MKNLYDEHVCGACGQESENQKHVLQCNIIQQHNNECIQTNDIEYEEILGDNAENQLNIAKIFKENMKYEQNQKWLKLNGIKCKHNNRQFGTM